MNSKGIDGTSTDFYAISNAVRKSVLEMAFRSKSGHLGSSFSIVDILVALYFSHLDIDPNDLAKTDRDRFILSKGHACAALYATLAHRGFFPLQDLELFIQDGSNFPGHPSSHLLPGIEASTGSLGHGLSIATGIALASKFASTSHRSVVLVSDGECQEGSTWEAIMSAGHWKLGSLTCVVDYNKLQAFGRTQDVLGLEPFAEKWKAFGWHVQEVDGHNHAALLLALAEADRMKDQPSVLIAHTVKGKGVTFMEDVLDWHYWSPKEDRYALAMAELSHNDS